MADNNITFSSKADLLIQLEESQEALQNLRFQKSMQQLEDLSQIKKIKKKVARINTIIAQQDKLSKSKEVSDV
jgi:ribosomal protein L29|tara:strand:+ start:797 stop:1015 length:219 start_codon:yes stop_codon:yes gene_type:complete